MSDEPKRMATTEEMAQLNKEIKAKKEFNFRALDQQIGGSHYKGMGIQPFVYAMKNNFNAGQFGVLKYISRYKMKNGLEDLRKAQHFLQLLAEEEYPGEKL